MEIFLSASTPTLSSLSGTSTAYNMKALGSYPQLTEIQYMFILFFFFFLCISTWIVSIPISLINHFLLQGLICLQTYSVNIFILDIIFLNSRSLVLYYQLPFLSSIFTSFKVFEYIYSSYFKIFASNSITSIAT